MRAGENPSGDLCSRPRLYFICISAQTASAMSETLLLLFALKLHRLAVQINKSPAKQTRENNKRAELLVKSDKNYFMVSLTCSLQL